MEKGYHHIHMNIDRETHEKLCVLSNQTNTKKSHIMAIALREFLRNYDTDPLAPSITTLKESLNIKPKEKEVVYENRI